MCGVEQEFPLPNSILWCYVLRNAIPFSERLGAFDDLSSLQNASFRKVTSKHERVLELVRKS